MNVTVRKIGNSGGVLFSKDVLERNNIKIGDHLTLTEDANGLHLRPSEEDSEEFEKKMKVARERMKKYEAVYRVLAK
jgi:putative addiction module antidote